MIAYRVILENDLSDPCYGVDDETSMEGVAPRDARAPREAAERAVDMATRHNASVIIVIRRSGFAPIYSEPVTRETSVDWLEKTIREKSTRK